MNSLLKMLFVAFYFSLCDCVYVKSQVFVLISLLRIVITCVGSILELLFTNAHVYFVPVFLLC